MFADTVGKSAAGPKADVQYQLDPIRWMVEVMGVPLNTLKWSLNPGYDTHKWDGTPDPLVVICEAIANGHDVAVESATGTGKTFLGALLVQWFTACFENAITVTTAPKEAQLTLHLWKELGGTFGKFKQRYPSAELIDLKLRMRPGTDEKEKWAAIGFACGVDAGAESATRAQGFHAEHLFLITEETPGIKTPVITAFENTLTGDHNLQLNFGNPDHQQDALHIRSTTPGVVAVRISALDHPNVVTGKSVIPGAVGRKSILKRREKWGLGSRLYESRIRGICPTESADALIKWVWCQDSVRLSTVTEMRIGPKALGVDVANSENGDKAAIARGVGSVMTDLVDFQCPNANKLGRDVVLEMQASNILPEYVGVDPVGVGAGTVNAMRDAGMWIQTLGGSMAQKIDVELFNNLRSQMWWTLRDDLQHGRIALVDDEELFNDLTSVTWKTHAGKIVIESKEDIKKRLGHSPNKGDAVVYWNWVRPRDWEAEQGKPPATTLEEIAWREQVGDLESVDDDEWNRRDEPDYGHSLRN
jgi:hypothetical protein